MPAKRHKRSTETKSRAKSPKREKGQASAPATSAASDGLPQRYKEWRAAESRREGERRIAAVSNAPPPPPVLRGGWIPPKPKRTQALTDFPPYYPSHLIARTTVVIGNALKKFPVQTQTLELGKYVISALTPDFRAALKDKRLRADLALYSMSELLRYVLVHNCDDPSERFSLEQEIKKSDEWMKLAEELTALAQAQAASLTAGAEARVALAERRGANRGSAPRAKEGPRVSLRPGEDQIKALIKNALINNPDRRGRSLCPTLDRLDVPLPKCWKAEFPNATWVKVYRAAPKRVGPYLSKIARDIG